MSDRPGFFIPYRYADDVRPIGYPTLRPLFEAARGRFVAMLADIARHEADFDRFGGAPPAPRFEQDWFPRLDACAAYGMVRSRRPGLIVEIGCGHSTRIMARAIEDERCATRLLCIDPAPRAKLHGLPVEHIPARVHELGAAAWRELCEADLLFVDSSHVAVPGSDVDLLVNGVLPELRAGTVIHFHDVFLPDAYPAEWRWRGYNEQLLVAALMQGEGYDLLFASAFVTRHMVGEVAATPVVRLPLPAGAIESSLWLEKRCPPVQSAYQNESGR